MTNLINRRFKAFIIDTGILGVTEVFIIILLMININENFLFIYSIATSIVFSLFFCKDMITGQSIGKKVLKLQVVSEKGEFVSLRNLILRNFIALLQPLDALYMINNDGKRLGDILCKTRVINVPEGKIKYKFSSLKIIICFIVVLFATFSFFYTIWSISKHS